MGNAQGGFAYRRDRRREMTFLFYFIFGFILIRVWILLIESKNVIVEIVGGVVTFLLLFSLIMRYRMLQQLGRQDPMGVNMDVNNPDLAALHALFRTPPRGLNQEIISSLYSFHYSAEKADDVRNGVVNPDGNYAMIPPIAEEIPSGTLALPGISSHEVKISGNNNDDLEAQVYDTHNCAQGEEQQQRQEQQQEQQIQLPEVEVNQCSICLEEYLPNDLVLVLPCRHMYHRMCVNEWLLAHTQCPLCKQDVLELLAERALAEGQIERLRQMSATWNNHIVYEEDEHTNIIRENEFSPIEMVNQAQLSIPSTSAPAPASALANQAEDQQNHSTEV
mmetsp:Transcript_96720/g.189972  ORF Transcript_96720/g.189972 Transcript_96720/m.189972 type:complete len:334 (+) Transcript_96720:69-1070(+)